MPAFWAMRAMAGALRWVASQPVRIFSVTGTSTNVAQRRAELVCDAPAGHDGPHSDSRHTETWEGELGKVTTLLRHQG